MLCTAVGELNTLVVFLGIRYPDEFGALSLYAAHHLALHNYCNWLSYSKALEAERVV